MVLLPARVRKRDLTDLLLHGVLGDGDGQPLETVLGVNLVPVAPVVLGVLHLVVPDEHICVVDQVEVTFPRDVVGLQDDGAHRINDE